ncbi:SDR family NAD(P)-dependent oxidoreductase [Streptomyces sp. CB01580]|uniref:SDR family NAD(P)-dependent oxidoreductase n=1 Tax=Streptomyces sp. CB01580 TaxID=1703933 RepID=UPI00093FAD60|nr:SDR family NAD(P)-dependent oxidoreductase [Streptomyces sp. CB01580]
MSVLDVFRIGGARALVTGASRGIGRAVALVLAEAGADLALSARTAENLNDTAHDVEAFGRRVAVLAADVAGPGAADDVVERASVALGGLDIVVHSAGLLPLHDDGTPVLVPLGLSSQADRGHVMSVNPTPRPACAVLPILTSPSPPGPA